MQTSHTTNSPIGALTIHATENAIVGLTIGAMTSSVVETVPTHPLLQAAVTQLDEYFAGTRKEFELPVAVSGTPFQEKIWSALSRIPYGHSMGYQTVGEAAGVGKAPRAVGGAVGANPLPIIIPCHRVLSQQQTITGYSGGDGIPTKIALLETEGISYR